MIAFHLCAMTMTLGTLIVIAFSIGSIAAALYGRRKYLLTYLLTYLYLYLFNELKMI